MSVLDCLSSCKIGDDIIFHSRNMIGTVINMYGFCGKYKALPMVEVFGVQYYPHCYVVIKIIKK